MIVGFRRFKLIAPDNHHVQLQGAYGALWNSPELTAQCVRVGGLHARPGTFVPRTQREIEWFEEAENRAEQHLLHDDFYHCTCGIYVVKNEDIVGNGTSEEWPVLAQVVAWGAYIEYEDGWHAQHVRIDQIWLDKIYSHYKSDLEDRYHVRVTIGRKACCSREHTTILFVENGEEKTICKLSLGFLYNLRELYQRMGNITYRTTTLEEINKELIQRAVYA